MKGFHVLTTLAITAALVLGLKYTAFHLTKPELPILGKAPHFELTNDQGKLFDSKELKGKNWVASFFFTSCPHVCPAMQERLKNLRKSVGDENLQAVSISIDPVTDTSETLSAFRKKIGDTSSSWHFLSEQRADAEALAYTLIEKGFKLPADKAPHHTARLVLVDGQGKIRGYYNGLSDSEIEKIASDLRSLL